MFKALSQYKKLDKSIINVIIAEFFIQLINTAYLAIIVVYINKEGYPDYQAADFLGYRYLSVLLLSFYMGFYIKGRKIKPLFYLSAIFTPILSLGIIYAIQFHIDILIYIGMFLLGAAVIGLQVSMLPYILRNVKEEHHTEAISLSYSTISLGGIISGVIIFGLSLVNPDLFTEGLVLKTISVVSLAGVYFVYASKKKEFYVPILKRSRYDLSDFDWWMVAKAMVPTLLLATGAGLAVPFMGIFFFKIHNIDSFEYAILGSITTVIVFIMTLYVPNIKNKLGYKATVTGSQSLAVLCLLGMSFSELYSSYAYAALIAVVCYMLRQPLMNIAAPITSDITMKFVGFRNREIVSALTAAIWSGSGFFGSKIFKFLRTHDIQYAYVFAITAALYVFGIVWYYYLIVLYERSENKV